MKLCQKLEFWVLSIPALMVSLGAISHYGVWRVLWVFFIGYALAAYVQFSKGEVYKALKGPRETACRNGTWPLTFGLVMLLATIPGSAFVNLTSGLFAIAVATIGVVAVTALGAANAHSRTALGLWLRGAGWAAAHGDCMSCNTVGWLSRMLARTVRSIWLGRSGEGIVDNMQIPFGAAVRYKLTEESIT